MEYKTYLRLFLVLLLLYYFYTSGFPLSQVIILGIFFIAIVFLRGPLYKKIDSVLVEKFPFIKSIHPWAKKLLMLLVFILVYILLKQIVFFLLSFAGIDMQGMLIESIMGMNQS